MGLLSSGKSLKWDEIIDHIEFIKTRGILHFINCWNENKDRKGEDLKWGDEIEYTLLHFNPNEKRVRASLRADEILYRLNEVDDEQKLTDWRPEYASYVLEGIPGQTMVGNLDNFNKVEENMKIRRLTVREMLSDGNEGDCFYDCLCITSLPRLGCHDFTWPTSTPTTDGISGSLFYPDEAIYNGHPRFRTLTRNIRDRRGKKVQIYIPIYRDINTPWPFRDQYSPCDDPPPDNFINMDCMGFGMGLSCLQVTFQTSNVSEARQLYDQLNPLCPILMALSASCPIFKGLLADFDARWRAIEASVDDRTETELAPPARPAKSRYGTVDCYLTERGREMNDIPIFYNEDHYKTLIDAGIDDLMASHVAHLFVRDPVSVFKEMVKTDENFDEDHFNNIQSTNWQSLRFKPPSSGQQSGPGWRVEFRPLDVQLTDFENSAFVLFVILITRASLSFNDSYSSIDFRIPISQVDENMQRAMLRDAILDQKFYFRLDSLDAKNSTWRDNVCEMSINEIMNGSSRFLGLIPFVWKYIKSHPSISVSTCCMLSRYLELFSKRASGDLMTNAKFIRDFVTSHKDYKNDSRVSELIEYDLLMLIREITEGKVKPPNLYPQ